MQKILKRINRNNFSVVFGICILTSCIQQNIKEVFIVPLDTMPIYKNTDLRTPPLPPPTRAYYFPANFIIDTAGEVFFYQKHGKWNNDARSDWNTPPEFIDLRPKDIIQIPVTGIEEFMKLNILNVDSTKRYIAIAAEKDTVQSLGLSKIIEMCKEKSNHIRWKFRMITQEELIVLDYKKRNKNYYPDEVKWDSTRISMPIKVKADSL